MNPSFEHPLNTTRPICTLCGSTDIELDGEERRPFYCRTCNSTEIKFPTPRRDPIEQMKTQALSSAMDTLDRAIEAVNNLGVTVEIPAPSYMNARDPVLLRSCNVDFRYTGNLPGGRVTKYHDPQPADPNDNFVSDIPIPTTKKFLGTEAETETDTDGRPYHPLQLRASEPEKLCPHCFGWELHNEECPYFLALMKEQQSLEVEKEAPPVKQMELPFPETIKDAYPEAYQESVREHDWMRYQRNALRTESNPASDPEIPKRILQHLRVLHAIMGKLTELGELADAFKKHWFYGAALDLTNVEEEIGDEKWYDAILLDALSLPLSSILAQNEAKLRKRYPNTFSSQDALERDLEGERATLENHSNEGDDYDYVRDDLNHDAQREKR